MFWLLSSVKNKFRLPSSVRPSVRPSAHPLFVRTSVVRSSILCSSLYPLFVRPSFVRRVFMIPRPSSVKKMFRYPSVCRPSVRRVVMFRLLSFVKKCSIFRLL
ncbi:unnamed protein product [Caenorhabditis nigoni]